MIALRIAGDLCDVSDMQSDGSQAGKAPVRTTKIWVIHFESKHSHHPQDPQENIQLLHQSQQAKNQSTQSSMGKLPFSLP